MVLSVSDEEIDVEEIMHVIRDKVRKKKEIEMSLQGTDHTGLDKQNDNSTVLAHLLESAYIENNSYAISSHRKVLGSYLVKGRELVHGEMRRYVDPVIWKQQEFNQSIVSVFKNFDLRMSEYENKLNELRRLQEQELEIQYIDFENTFRGTEDEIKKRISVYLRYFISGTILDIGCGRGEFLEILRDAGRNGKGIEINEQMYHHCKNKNLDVELIDAFEYLKRQADKSVDGIIMLQVIEHLSPHDIIEFLKLSYQKLKDGSYLILETVNIQNPGALSNFYVDPTHKWPVHPEFLKYIAESKGFVECEILYRLYQENAPQIEQDQLKMIAPDYALICKKNGAKS
ncbi:hypothetical protein BGV40_15310 [Methanosarcina sp. Ant1]|nr:hypothetical protein BGV40_15310 [Methanosarcina sp. Ant1]